MKRLVAAALAMGCATMQPRITAADVAGIWDVEARVEGNGAVATRYVLTIDRVTGWTIQFPGGVPPVHPRVIAMAGDSIVTRTDPYPSTLRPGVFVVTEGVFRLRDGKMIGRSVAHYSVSTPDSVRRISTVGTRR